MPDLKISQFASGGAVQPSDEIATNRAGVNTKVAVGTAAALDVGTSVGDIPQFGDDGGGGAQYPAGDGSQLTNIVASEADTLSTARNIGGVLFDGSADIVPQTIQVADAAGDTTMFVALFGAATGNMQPLTDAGFGYNATTNTAGVSISGNAATATAATSATSAASATVSTTSTIANEASDATCFFNFVTAATGDLPLKTNANAGFDSSTGIATFGGIVVDSANPRMTWYQNDVAVDAKRWEWDNSGGTGAMQLRTRTDSGTGGTVAWQLLRGGDTTVTGQNWINDSGPFTFNQNTLGAEVFRVQSTATNDDPARKIFQGRVATTDATVTTVLTFTVAASTNTFLDAYVVARRTGGVSGAAEDGGAYRVTALVKNVAGTATLIGSATTTVIGESTGTMDCTITVTGATALVRVTGVGTTNFTWHCTCDAYSVST